MLFYKSYLVKTEIDTLKLIALALEILNRYTIHKLPNGSLTFSFGNCNFGAISFIVISFLQLHIKK